MRNTTARYLTLCACVFGLLPRPFASFAQPSDTARTHPATLSCTATPSCYLAGYGPGEVVAGQVVVSCNQATMLKASATICGDVGGCVTNSVAPPVPVQSLDAGDASRGNAGSCQLSWSWGGTNYSQNFNVQ